jgi:hypothetical protein
LNVERRQIKEKRNAQHIVICGLVLTDIIDEEIMLVHINLNARCTSIEFQEGLCAVLVRMGASDNQLERT